jgi:HEPN domain-containing protein
VFLWLKKSKPNIMETQTSHRQHQRFSSFIKVLAEKFNPQQIYCFGTQVVLRDKSGCFIEGHTDERYHYYLLMVTEGRVRIEHSVQDFVNTHFNFGTITVLVHGKDTITEALTANNRFFNTVFSSAQVVYSYDGLLSPELISPFIPSESAIKAEKHYSHRMSLADGFLAGASECLIKEQFSVCVFMLHQVVEQTCIALIRVYLAYRAEIHNLHRLLSLCSYFSDKPATLLLSGNKEDERLFDILLRSYSSARYSDNFKVLMEDARLLFHHVEDFLILAKKMCSQKIEALSKEAESYRQLSQGSEACHE